MAPKLGVDLDRELVAGLLAQGALSLRSADRMAGLGTLVAGVAHELNNPITYVLANLNELGRLGESLGEALQAHRAELWTAFGPRAEPALKRIEELESSAGLALMRELVSETLLGAGRIRDTIRELLSYARTPEGECAPIDLEEVIEFDLRMMRAELRGCACVVRDYRATRRVRGNRASLGQVVLNLLRNAVQACGRGEPERHRITASTRDCPGGIEIEIADTGPGIAPELRPQLFKPFFSTKSPEHGTGLGLYISRWIVEEHGGTLEFVCPREGGTRFRIFLPLSAE